MKSRPETDQWMAVDGCGWVRLTQDHCWDHRARQGSGTTVPRGGSQVMKSCRWVWKLGRSRRALHVPGLQPSKAVVAKRSPWTAGTGCGTCIDWYAKIPGGRVGVLMFRSSMQSMRDPQDMTSNGSTKSTQTEHICPNLMVCENMQASGREGSGHARSSLGPCVTNPVRNCLGKANCAAAVTVRPVLRGNNHMLNLPAHACYLVLYVS